MIQIEHVKTGKSCAQGVRILAPGGEDHPNMLVILCEKGYIMCGYLNMETSEAVDDAAAIVGGATFEDLLKNPVKAVSAKAAELGVTVGMTGAEAADRLNGVC